MRIEDMYLGMEVRGPQGHAIVKRITSEDSHPIMVEYDGVPQWGNPEQYEPAASLPAIRIDDVIDALRARHTIGFILEADIREAIKNARRQ